MAEMLWWRSSVTVVLDVDFGAIAPAHALLPPDAIFGFITYLGILTGHLLPPRRLLGSLQRHLVGREGLRPDIVQPICPAAIVGMNMIGQMHGVLHGASDIAHVRPDRGVDLALKSLRVRE